MMNTMLMPLKNPQECAIVSIFTPCEILHEAGLHPYNVEAFSCYLSASNAERAFLQQAENTGISETLCSYHKTFLGAAQKKILPKPKCIVYTNLTCDANLLTFKTLAKLYDVPAFAIDVPMQQNEDNVKYVADQIRDLKVFLEKCTGKTITEDGLKERMRRSKRTMDKFIECQKKSADKDIKTDLVTPLFAGMTNNILLGTKEEEKYVDQLLKDIYVDESVLAYQQERYIKALGSFEKIYGEKEVEIYSAPGRSEVGGNHTDHQFGKVLATSINLDAIAIVAKRDDDVIDLKSEGYERIIVSLSSFDPAKAEKGTSQALIQGVASKLKEEGYKIGGFEAYVTSDVLNGAGMSSSAAFEVLIGNILSGLYNDMKIDPVFLAQAGQYAENVYFGKPCGLMDQMASSVGNLIFIDFADVKNPVIKKVNVNFEDFNHSLCIVDTKGSHADLTDEYAAIPEEMKRVAAYFGKEILKQVDKNEFYTNIPEIRKVAGDRAVLRAMHWFEETDRVIDQVNALEEENFEEFKKLIKSSGDSSFKYLQNVYSVKNLSRQEMAVGLALSDVILKGKGVSRVHGGGFAGTIQAFVPNDIVDIYKKNMEDIFGEDACHVLKIRKYGGMKVL